MRGKPISDEALKKFFKENPKINQKFNSSKPAASVKDAKVLSNVRHFKDGEGKGKDVQFLTYESMGGVNETEMQNQRRRLANEQGIRLAPESRKLSRPPKSTNFVEIEHLYELMPELRGKMITRKALTEDGALAHASPPPRVPSTPKALLRFRGTLGSGLKIAGGILIEIIIYVVLHWLSQKLMEKWQREFLDADMKSNVTPQLVAAIDTKRKVILENLREGKKAFAKVVFRYFKMWPNQDGSGGQGFGPDDPFSTRSVRQADLDHRSKDGSGRIAGLRQ